MKDFYVIEVKPETDEVRVRHGSIVLTCKVLDTVDMQYVKKPPYLYFDADVWPDFINLVRTAWQNGNMMEKKDNGTT